MYVCIIYTCVEIYIYIIYIYYIYIYVCVYIYTCFCNFFPSFLHFPDSKGQMGAEKFMMS